MTRAYSCARVGVFPQDKRGEREELVGREREREGGGERKREGGRENEGTVEMRCAL